MNNFQKFCNLIEIHKLSKIDIAIHFLWFHEFVSDKSEANVKTINEYFVKARLPEFPITRLKDNFTKNAKVTKGSIAGSFKLHRKTHSELNDKYLIQLSEESISIKEKVSLSETPFLNDSDVNNAHTMAELYVIVHCFEN